MRGPSGTTTRVAAAVVAWALVVVAFSGLTWVVIDTAGQEVLGAAAPTVPAGTPTATPDSDPDVTAPTRPASPTSKPTRSPRPSATATGPAQSPDPAPVATSPAPGGPDDGGGSGGGSTPPPKPPASPKPSPSDESDPEPEPTVVRRTWSGPAGSVTARCTGGDVSLQSASPNDGWTVEVEKRGPDEVEVEFRERDGDRRTKVDAECSGGVPRFSVENEGGDEESGSEPESGEENDPA